MTIRNTIGARLYDLRISRGETQEQVANDCGITSVSLSRYETGQHMPKMDILARLAEHYGTTTDKIINGPQPKTAPAITDDDIKFALFGGAEGITDADYEDVKRYAAFIASKRNQ